MIKIIISVLLIMLIFPGCASNNDSDGMTESKIIVNSESLNSVNDENSSLQLNAEYFTEDTDDVLLNYFKYNIPESVLKSYEMLKSIEFNGKEASLEYIESRYRCGIDDSRDAMYDAYDVYKSADGEIYYIRADGKVLYYTNYNYIKRITDVDEAEAKAIGDEYLAEIFGDDADKYTYTHVINVGLTYAVCYAKMNGEVKTTDMVIMYFNSNDEFVSFSASDCGRYDDIAAFVSEQTISSCNDRLKAALSSADNSSEYEFSEYILGEYNGELYLFTNIKDSENETYFFIPVK